MSKWLVIVSMLFQCALALCPYSSLDTSAGPIRVADEFCPSSAECFVNSNCELTTTNTTTYRAVGNMTNYNQSKLSLSGTDINLQYMVLPPKVTYLEMIAVYKAYLMGLKTSSWPSVETLKLNECMDVILSNTVVWPPKLKTLIAYYVNIRNIPQNLPSTLRYLSITCDSLNDLNYLPENTLTGLNLYSDKIQSITTRDWRNFTYLNLGYNPLTTFAFVQLSSALQYFNCQNCNLTNITIDAATYSALNALKPFTGDGIDDGLSTWLDNFNLKGYVFDKNVSTDRTGCSAIGGNIKPLFQSTPNISVTACVVATSAIATSSNTSSTVIIIAIVAGIAVIAVAIVVYLRKRRQVEEDNNNELDLAEIRPHRLETSDLSVTSKAALASGAFGEVWLGTYRSQPVAIKRLKSRDPKQVQMFINEIALMASLECDYIVKFIGASWIRPVEIECIVEYMNLGDLRGYLANHSPEKYSWDEKYKSILSIVDGLIYLHTYSPPIIHRDLKSRNVLLDSVKGTKLTDFGISKAVEDDENSLTSGIGTYQWMAPEVIASTKYSSAADIYSFGIVLSEFCTHQVPYSAMGPNKTSLSYLQVLKRVGEGNLTPSFGDSAPEWVKEMALQCLQLDPDNRPTALELSYTLRHLKYNKD